MSSYPHFVQDFALGGISVGAGLWPHANWALQSSMSRVLAGTDFDLVVGETLVGLSLFVIPAKAGIHTISSR
ncbi:hypothetical protein LDO31_08695 [Luteimonas sp. XNQY3]|nr:hypothetical protein [Luteimonas sp. XNQY3]MCD9006311.1 hypothetical protein [Luteimonas sp. XNQY3]